MIAISPAVASAYSARTNDTAIIRATQQFKLGSDCSATPATTPMPTTAQSATSSDKPGLLCLRDDEIALELDNSVDETLASPFGAGRYWLPKTAGQDSDVPQAQPGLMRDLGQPCEVWRATMNGRAPGRCLDFVRDVSASCGGNLATMLSACLMGAEVCATWLGLWWMTAYATNPCESSLRVKHEFYRMMGGSGSWTMEATGVQLEADHPELDSDDEAFVWIPLVLLVQICCGYVRLILLVNGFITTGL